MLLIEHRVNTIAHLRATPPDRGVEVDVRDYDGALRLCHDPLETGERLDDFLGAYRHRLIIFNTKCDGLVEPILALAERHGVADHFFLDLAAPTLVRMARAGMRKAAVRFSAYEPLAAVMPFAGLIDWAWIDCFDDLPLDPATHAALAERFKTCVVSPELQGHGRGQIPAYRERLRAMPVDAVCTDFCDDWSRAPGG